MDEFCLPLRLGVRIIDRLNGAHNERQFTKMRQRKRAVMALSIASCVVRPSIIQCGLTESFRVWRHCSCRPEWRAFISQCPRSVPPGADIGNVHPRQRSSDPTGSYVRRTCAVAGLQAEARKVAITATTWSNLAGRDAGRDEMLNDARPPYIRAISRRCCHGNRGAGSPMLFIYAAETTGERPRPPVTLPLTLWPRWVQINLTIQRQTPPRTKTYFETHVIFPPLISKKSATIGSEPVQSNLVCFSYNMAYMLCCLSHCLQWRNKNIIYRKARRYKSV